MMTGTVIIKLSVPVELLQPVAFQYRFRIIAAKNRDSLTESCRIYIMSIVSQTKNKNFLGHIKNCLQGHGTGDTGAPSRSTIFAVQVMLQCSFLISIIEL